MLKLMSILGLILVLNPLWASQEQASLVETAPISNDSLAYYQTFIGTL